ncbi:MAG: STAS domain-containing protein [Pseudomonadota bacterium]
MSCGIKHEGATSTITVAGRFVFELHRAFRDAYEEAQNRAQTTLVVIDLSGVEYLDSSALGMMLLMKERLVPAGKKIQLKGAAPMVRRILETANFQKLFEIV